MKDHVTIILRFNDGSVGRMFFGTVRDPESANSKNKISRQAAIDAGFVFDIVGKVWRRQPTQELVDLEISRTVFSSPRSLAGQSPTIVTVTSWIMVANGHPFEKMDHRWAAAWDSQGGVDIAMARTVRKRELLSKRNILLKLARDRKSEAEEDKKTKTEIDALIQKAKDLRDLDLTIDTQLAAINDLLTLAVFEPPVFAGL